MYAYPDAQRYRLGVNYPQLPPNRTVAPVYAPFERDGMATTTNNYDGTPNYVPSILAPAVGNTSAQEVRHEEWLRGGAVLGLNAIPEGAEDYVQPRELWKRVFDENERRRWVANVVETLHGVPVELRRAAIEMFNKVEPEIGAMITAKLSETARL